jgi:hypothetical protein
MSRSSFLPIGFEMGFAVEKVGGAYQLGAAVGKGH